MLHHSALDSSAGLLPMMGVFAVTSFVAGSLYDRLGARRVLTSGAVCLGIGMLLLSFLGADSAITTTAVTALDASRSSLAGGIISVCQIAGEAVGPGLNTAIVATASSLADGIALAFRLDALLAVAGLVVVLIFIRPVASAPSGVEVPRPHPRALRARHRAHT